MREGVRERERGSEKTERIEMIERCEGGERKGSSSELDSPCIVGTLP